MPISSSPRQANSRPSGATALLGIEPNTLASRIHALGIYERHPLIR